MVGWQSPAPDLQLVGPQRAMDRIPSMARTSFSAPEAHIVVSTDGYFDVYPSSAADQRRQAGLSRSDRGARRGNPRHRRPARRPARLRPRWPTPLTAWSAVNGAAALGGALGGGARV